MERIHYRFGRPDIFSDRIGFVVYRKLDVGKYEIAEPLLFKPKQPGEMLTGNEVAMLTADEAQEAMDSLWEAGIRPSQGKGSAGQLEAVQSHVKDLRKIAFKTLGVADG